MKTIMISNKPKSAEQIMNGKKTIEFRKFYIEPPFKVVNYVTEGQELWGDGTGDTWKGIAEDQDIEEALKYTPTLSRLNGKVAFEYVVNKVEKIDKKYIQAERLDEETYLKIWDIVKNACLDKPKNLRDYLKGKDGYAWHISDLKIYDKPKELREFRKVCKHILIGIYCFSDNSECQYFNSPYCSCNGLKPITRPPQNFVYIEDLSEVEK